MRSVYHRSDARCRNASQSPGEALLYAHCPILPLRLSAKKRPEIVLVQFRNVSKPRTLAQEKISNRILL